MGIPSYFSYILKKHANLIIIINYRNNYWNKKPFLTEPPINVGTNKFNEQ